MKRNLQLIAITILLFSITACKKSSTSEIPNNSLASLNGSWYVTNWNGIANNLFVFKIDQNLKTGIVQTVGTDPAGYSLGETVLSNIATTTNTTVFTGNAIFKYGNNNTNTANTTATLTLQANGTQLLVKLAAAQGIQPPDWIYVKQ
jgi:hypothetical protein